MRIAPLATMLSIGVLAACGTSTGTRAVPNDRPVELPPSVTNTGSSVEVRTSNPDRGFTMEIAVPPEQAWQALLETFNDFEFEPDGIDTRTRQIAVEGLSRSRIAGERAESLVRCGNSGAGPSAASRFRIRFSFVSRVLPDEGSSIVHTRVQASATPIDGSSIGRVGCVSTGSLEERIHTGVSVKLGIAPKRD